MPFYTFLIFEPGQILTQKKNFFLIVFQKRKNCLKEVCAKSPTDMELCKNTLGVTVINVKCKENDGTLLPFQALKEEIKGMHGLRIFTSIPKH